MPTGEALAREVAGGVPDPELPALTLEDLGVLRSVDLDASGRVSVVITPTYSGCPALEVMTRDLEEALTAVGFQKVEVRVQLDPAWDTDSLGPRARPRLAGAGIAPPPTSGQPLRLSPRCPRCGSPRTRELSRFGATACKSLWRCEGCAEPFEHFKALR